MDKLIIGASVASIVSAIVSVISLFLIKQAEKNIKITVKGNRNITGGGDITVGRNS